MKERAKRILSVLVAMSMVLSMWPTFMPDAEAAETDEENTFILETVTGSLSGERVSYFAIRYMDNDNIQRVQYIFPHMDLKAGYQTVQKKGGTAADKEKNVLNANYGLQHKGDKNSYDNAVALQAYHQDMFLFTMDYAVKKITSIEVFGRFENEGVSTDSAEKNSWSCQCMRVYQVKKLYGLERYGEYSMQYFIDFDGELLAEVEMQDSFIFRWSYSDVLFRIGVDNIGCSLKTDMAGTEYSTHTESEIIFKIDIADVYGAGIEKFVTPYGGTGALKDLPIDEVLALELEYRDTFNKKRYVNLPVVTGSLEYAKEHSGGKITGDSRVVGYMQQGDSIILGGRLPGFGMLTKCSLRYGQTTAKESIGISGGNSSVQLASNEELKIVGLSVYSGKNTTAKAELKGGTIVTSVTGNESKPICYYTASSSEGLALTQTNSMDANSANTLRINEYTTNARLSPKEPTDRYLLIITTDDATIAGTTSDLICSLQYQTIGGDIQQTGMINVRESMQNYFGYWPGIEDDVVYLTGASSGGKLYVLTQISNVDFFTGVSIQLEAGGTDDWQGKKIELYKLDNGVPLGKRESTWQTVTDSTGKVLSDRVFSRQYKGENVSPPEFREGEKMLVLPGETLNSSFQSQSVVVDKDVDWSNLRYSMTLAEAKQGLGFKKIRASYIVEVHVAGEDGADVSNGDCGSKNQFYFQLVFEQGKSGYVLANQQLSADGFRSGQTESFRVYTNQDYGKLTAIQIIPEDPNKPDEAFDKLKISYVEVKKDSDAELSISWKIAIEDWISFDYRDIAAQDTMRGQEGRSEAEMARTYLVSSSGFSVNLLFALTTGTYTNQEFDGALRATIAYYDTNGRVCTKEVDVIEEMYNYAKRTAVYAKVNIQGDGQDSAESKSWDPTRQYAKPDHSFMLRPNSTDRFIVPLTDVREITSVTLHVSAVTSGYWTIKALNVYRITSGGVLTINAQNEYQSTAETSLLCTNSYDQGYELFYPANGAGQSQVIEMTGENIDVNLNQGWISSLDYVPQSKDDKLNIYVYMSDNMDGIPLGGNSGQFKAAVQYMVSSAQVTGSDGISTGVTDAICQTSTLLQPGSTENVYYAKGVQVSGITGIKDLTLQDSQDSPVDYAIIEQVRSGVVIGTYYFHFGSNALYSICKEASRNTTKESEKQTVYLLFNTDSTEELVLRNKKNDVVVSISYKSSADPWGGEINSPNIFLSEQGIASIKNGQLVSLDFDQSYVQEITAITVTAIGALSDKIGIDMACVGTYKQQTEGGDWNNTGWFSFANPVVNLNLSPRRMLQTASASTGSSDTLDSVTPITITFKTAESTTSDSGTKTPVRMKLVYSTQLNDSKEKNYSDIVPYLASGSFQSGSNATIELMVADISELRYIEVEPYDNSDPYDRASWHLSGVTVKYVINGKEWLIERTLDDTAVEGTGLKINLSDIVLSVDTLTYSVRDGANSYHTVRSDKNEGGNVNILVEPGQTVKLTPTLLGSLDTIDYTCDRVVDGATATANSCLQMQNGVLVFTPFKNTSGTPEYYCVTIYSIEIPSICVVVNLTAESEAAPVEVEFEYETPALTKEALTDDKKESSSQDDSDDDSTEET